MNDVNGSDACATRWPLLAALAPRHGKPPRDYVPAEQVPLLNQIERNLRMLEKGKRKAAEMKAAGIDVPDFWEV